MKYKAFLLVLFLITSVHAEIFSESLTDPTNDVIFIDENDEGIVDVKEVSDPILDSVDIVSVSYEYDSDNQQLTANVELGSEFVTFSDESYRQVYFRASNSYECSINTCKGNDVVFTYNYMTKGLNTTVNSKDTIGNVTLGDKVVTFETTLSGSASVAEEVFTRTRTATYSYYFEVRGYFPNESTFSDDAMLSVDLSGNVELDLPFPIFTLMMALLLIPVIKRVRQ